MNIINKSAYYGSMLIFSMLLLGCGDNKQDLNSWISQIKAKTVSKSPYVEPLKEYINQPYTSTNLVSPFSITKVGSSISEAPPDGMRSKDPLESIPLEDISFVGSLARGKQIQAMIKVKPDNKVHQVSVGRHLGQNYGKIISIKEQEIKVKELIKDGEGKWNDKIVTLTLNSQ
jgi:type IV pilus assembly protein PilP